MSADREAQRLVASTVLALVALGSVSLFIPVDAYVHASIQELGLCQSGAVATWLDRGILATLTLLVAATVLAGRLPVGTLAVATVVAASGPVWADFLKTAFYRLRPRSMPWATVSNSMPSGHILGTTVVALVVWTLIRRTGWPLVYKRLAGVVLVTVVMAQAAARVLRGSHWPSDVGPSILLGVVWVLAAQAVFRRRLLPRFQPVLATFVAAYAIVYAVPSTRLHLPSLLDEPRRVVSAADALPTSDLHAVAGIGAAATETTMWSPTQQPDWLEAVFQVSCGREGAVCPQVRVVMNRWSSEPFELRCGRRWYRVQPPADVLHTGRNVVQVVRVDDACGTSPSGPITLRTLALIAEAT